jgi:ADP-ribosylglycohydrolase
MEDDGLIPEHLANRLASDRLYKPGRAMQQFQRRYTNERLPWTEAGVESAGTGALKRIAPILIPHLCRPTTALWADTLLASMITHNDRGSNAACVAFVAIFWDLLHMKTPPEEGWWVFRFRQVASDLEGNTHYRHCVPNHEYDHDGPIWVFVEDSVCDALRHGWSTLDACSMWRSGAYLLETLPSLIYILEKYAAQPEQAIVRAVNDTQHSATIAALVGAAVGALHGRDALPSRWIENLLGRTRAGDDGHVFELIASAKEQFFTESHWHYSVLDNSPNLL